MIPTFLILPILCALSDLGVLRAAQNPAPKPAGLLPDARKWIDEHAADWEKGGFLAERLRTPKTIVFVLPQPSGRAAPALKRCAETLFARETPFVLCVPQGWEEGCALDRWLADGKLAPPARMEKELFDLARAWNADEKHAHKLRAAGVDYRATQEQAIGLVEFIAQIDPEVEQRAGQLFGPFRQLDPDGHHRYGKTDSNWRFAVQQLLSDFAGQADERRAEWEKSLGPAAVAAGLRNLQRMRQAEQETSSPSDLRRGHALCKNALAARDELAPGTDLLALVDRSAGLEAKEMHEALGADALLVLLLAPDDANPDPDLAALAGVRASGALDLRELPKEGVVAAWFAAHLGARADLVLWSGSR